MARAALDLERESQEVEAAREALRASRADARASTASEWVALGVLVLLAATCAGVIVWILVWSDLPREARAGSVSVALSTFCTLMWLTLKRADARRRTPSEGMEHDADGGPAEEDEELAEAAPNRILRWLRARVR